MNELTKFHIDNNYYVKVKRSDKMNAVVVNIPKNIITNSKEKEIIYEIDKTNLNVYFSGSKQHSLECKEYSIRMIVFADIVHNAILANIPPQLIAVYDKDGNVTTGENSIINVIDPPKRKSDRVLEDKLILSFHELKETDEVEIEESIKDSFTEIIEIYLKGIK